MICTTATASTTLLALGMNERKDVWKWVMIRCVSMSVNVEEDSTRVVDSRR